MKVHQYISAIDRETIRKAVQSAEKRTSGEIRVYIENSCKDEVLDRAAWIFGQLKMDQTELRNGVLIYIAFKDRKFCIIGDKGINECVKPDFWDAIKNQMLLHFSNNRFAEGITSAVQEAGEALSVHFPFNASDKNELSDDVVIGGFK